MLASISFRTECGLLWTVENMFDNLAHQYGRGLQCVSKDNLPKVAEKEQVPLMFVKATTVDCSCASIYTVPTELIRC